MPKYHNYKLKVQWTGNTGSGTSAYTAYERSHTFSADGKPEIFGTADPAFLGDKNKYNPEELLLGALSACHMMWFLHLCSDEGIIVTDYVDNPKGKVIVNPDGTGHYTEITLHPLATIKGPADIKKLNSLHEQSHKFCFISNSMNFPIRIEPQWKQEE